MYRESAPIAVYFLPPPVLRTSLKKADPAPASREAISDREYLYGFVQKVYSRRSTAETRQHGIGISI